MHGEVTATATASLHSCRNAADGPLLGLCGVPRVSARDWPSFRRTRQRGVFGLVGAAALWYNVRRLEHWRMFMLRHDLSVVFLFWFAGAGGSASAGGGRGWFLARRFSSPLLIESTAGLWASYGSLLSGVSRPYQNPPQRAVRRLCGEVCGIACGIYAVAWCGKCCKRHRARNAPNPRR